MMRMRSYRLLLLLLIGLIMQFGLKAQLYNMVTYGLKDGLPEERLNCLMQDSDGYIWIGARFGLYKFNGKKFSPIPLPASIRARFVNHLIEDSRKRIWVSLNGSGLVLIEKSRVTQILIQPSNTNVDFSLINSAIVNSINSFYEIKPDLFLALTDEGLFLFDTKRFISLDKNFKDGKGAGFQPFYRASFTHDSIWVKTSDELFLLKLISDTSVTLLKKYVIKGGTLASMPNGRLVIGG